MTYFGSTDKGGTGATRGVWTVISSFGGTYDDGKGNMLLNTPENIAAIEFLRTLTVKGYVPEVTFAGGFQEEEAFKDSSAASIPTGLFGYRYLRPLTAPDGTKYETQTEQDMLKAIEDGKVVLRPFAAPPGKKPGGGLSVRGVGIPTGAKNREAAEAFINWVLTHADVAADYALRGESGLPVLFAAYDQPQFQGKLYQQAKAVVQASALRPWKGTLERTAEAQMIIMNAVYKLVKEDVTADIPTVLKQAEDEYNAGK
jgi:multiple sugar transport system substrate-binding protein